MMLNIFYYVTRFMNIYFTKYDRYNTLHFHTLFEYLNWIFITSCQKAQLIYKKVKKCKVFHGQEPQVEIYYHRM